jgi:hypothetical protein
VIGEDTIECPTVGKLTEEQQPPAIAAKCRRASRKWQEALHPNTNWHAELHCTRDGAM